jgi:hypothetical protein
MQLTRKVMLGAAALALLAGSAEAQQVRFRGTTTGCFWSSLGAPCVAPAPGGGSVAGFGSFQFDDASFDAYTDPAGFGGLSFLGIGSNNLTNSHGLFTVTGAFAPAPGVAYYLRLQTTLLGPTVTGSNVYVDDLRIVGSTGGPGFGGVNLSPIPPLGTNPITVAQPFTNGQVFGGGTAAGTIDFWNYDTQSITSGSSAVYLSSFLQINSTVSTVPEPATVALMATGIVGLFGAGLVRRRNNA